MTDIAINDMTIEQTRAAAQELLDSTTGDLAGADAERFHALQARAEQVRTEQQQKDTVRRSLVQGVASGEFMVERGSPHADDTPQDRTPAVAMRDNASRALDRAVSADKLSARGAEVVTELMHTGTAGVQSWTQRWAAAAGSEEYERAFAHLVANPTHGHLRWTPAEAKAYRTVAALQTEQRAMGLTDNVGGYMVPLTLDPAIQLSSGGSINPLRQLARVVQTTTDTWQGVTSAGVTAEWTAEAAEVADASPTLAGPSIPVFKGDAFVPFSFEVEGELPLRAVEAVGRRRRAAVRHRLHHRQRRQPAQGSDHRPGRRVGHRRADHAWDRRDPGGR